MTDGAVCDARGHLRLVLAVVLVLILGLVPAHATAGTTPWKPLGATLVAQGLDMPVDFAIAPDGTVYYVELFGGNVRRLDPATGAIDPSPVATVRGFSTGGERGVFGLALDPDFPRTRAVYVSYSRNGTEPGSTVNVLSRFVDGAETILFERPGDTMHNGGRLLFADGHLFVTTGDATSFRNWSDAKARRAQDPQVPAGKILRLTPDGKPAPGNPWGSAAWSLGHRNVYGIAYDPESKRLMATENGNERADEINVIVRGGNYGWPDCAGPCDPAREKTTDPAFWYERTIAPTGATFFRGDFWFSDFNQGRIHRLRENDEGAFVDEIAHTYAGAPSRVLDLEAGADRRSLWFTSWSELWRLDFADDDSGNGTIPTHPTGPTDPGFGGAGGSGNLPPARPTLAPSAVAAALALGVAAWYVRRR